MALIYRKIVKRDSLRMMLFFFLVCRGLLCSQICAEVACLRTCLLGRPFRWATSAVYAYNQVGTALTLQLHPSPRIACARYMQSAKAARSAIRTARPVHTIVLFNVRHRRQNATPNTPRALGVFGCMLSSWARLSLCTECSLSQTGNVEH